MNAVRNDRHNLLAYVELLMTDPKHIRRQALAILARVEAKHQASLDRQAILKLAGDKIIAHYANLTAFTGGATALAGMVPGLGTVVAMIGGAATDTALCLKFQVEMTMALATIYGHDILDKEAQLGCELIAGIGLVTEQAKQSGKIVGTKMFVSMVRKHLSGSTLLLTKVIFKRIGLRFTRTAFVKAIPLGVGVLIGAGGNKIITTLVGKQVREYFLAANSVDTSANQAVPDDAVFSAELEVIDVDFTSLD